MIWTKSPVRRTTAFDFLGLPDFKRRGNREEPPSDPRIRFGIGLRPEHCREFISHIDKHLWHVFERNFYLNWSQLFLHNFSVLNVSSFEELDSLLLLSFNQLPQEVIHSL